MKKETQEKIDSLNKKINVLKESIANCYDNSERARLDSEIKKCRKEIDELNKSELKPCKVATKIDAPTVLDNNHRRAAVGPGGTINKLGGGNFSINI